MYKKYFVGIFCLICLICLNISFVLFVHFLCLYIFFVFFEYFVRNRRLLNHQKVQHTWKTYKIVCRVIRSRQTSEASGVQYHIYMWISVRDIVWVVQGRKSCYQRTSTKQATRHFLESCIKISSRKSIVIVFWCGSITMLMVLQKECIISYELVPRNVTIVNGPSLLRFIANSVALGSQF